MPGGKVFPGIEPLTEQQFKSLFAQGVARAVGNYGLQRLALWIGSCTKTLTNAIAAKGSMRAELVLNSITADPAAFSALFARLGWQPAAITETDLPDVETVSLVSELLTEWLVALRDGRRNHTETLRITARIRPLLPALTALVHQADRIGAPACGDTAAPTPKGKI